MQFICILLMITFLIRLRILSTRLALQHDRERLTTADFSLMFSGLEHSCTADELVAALSTELAELGFDEVRTHARSLIAPTYAHHTVRSLSLSLHRIRSHT